MHCEDMHFLLELQQFRNEKIQVGTILTNIKYALVKVFLVFISIYLNNFV